MILKALAIMGKHVMDIVGHSLAKAVGKPEYSTKTTDAYHPQNVFIGKNVQLAGYINPGKEGKITIEDDVAIGHYTSIVGEQFSDIKATQQDIKTLPKKYREIVIGKGAWIGNSCVIMASVGKGAVVGAGSVVIRDVPDYAIVLGNPARIVSRRKNL